MFDDLTIWGIVVPWYNGIVVFTVIFVIAFVIGIKRKDGYLPFRNIIIAGLYIIFLTIVGFFGARMLAYFEHIVVSVHKLNFTNDLNGIINNSFGASWYGGFILVTLFVIPISFIVYGKKERVTFLNYHAMLVSLAYALGRQACFISADGCYGIPTNSIFGMRFLHGFKPTLLTVYPTPLFESIISFVLFLGLLTFRKANNLIPFATFLTLFGASRFFIEFIRVNPKILYDLTMAQLISILLMLAGCIILFYQVKVKLKSKSISYENKNYNFNG